MNIKSKKRHAGSILAEYVAVILGFVVFVMAFPMIMSYIREHYSEYSWTLSLPF